MSSEFSSSSTTGINCPVSGSRGCLSSSHSELLFPAIILLWLVFCLYSIATSSGRCAPEEVLHIAFRARLRPLICRACYLSLRAVRIVVRLEVVYGFLFLPLFLRHITVSFGFSRTFLSAIYRILRKIGDFAVVVKIIKLMLRVFRAVEREYPFCRDRLIVPRKRGYLSCRRGRELFIYLAAAFQNTEKSPIGHFRRGSYPLRLFQSRISVDPLFFEKVPCLFVCIRP